MKSEDISTVTLYIGPLKSGDPDAIRVIWARYFERLARRAEPGLRGLVFEGGEDIAQSAFP